MFVKKTIYNHNIKNHKTLHLKGNSIMAYQKWLTHANKYNFKRINEPNFVSYLANTTFGIGNTRVSVPSMQGQSLPGMPTRHRAIDQTQLYKLNQGKLVRLKQMNRSGQRVSAQDITNCFDRYDQNTDLWCLATKAASDLNHFEADSAECNQNVVSNLRRNVNNRVWTSPNGRATCTKEALMKEFTKEFYDLAVNNIGLDLDFEIDTEKLNDYHNRRLLSTAQPVEFLKIKPIFNLAALTASAKQLLQPRSIAGQQGLTTLYRQYMRTQKVENFEINISNILRNENAAARQVDERVPVLGDLSRIPDRWEPHTLNHIIWHNLSNKYSFGNLTYMGDGAIGRENFASRLDLKTSMDVDFVNRRFKLISPNLELQTDAFYVKGLNGIQLCSASDFATQEAFTAQASFTNLQFEYTQSNGSQSMQNILVPPEAKAFLEATFATEDMLRNRRGQARLTHAESQRRLAYVQSFVAETDPAFQKNRDSALPYGTPRFLAYKTIPKNIPDYFIQKHPQTGFLSLAETANGVRNRDVRVVTNVTVPVLYARCSIMVSINSLARALRGCEFQTLQEGSKLVDPNVTGGQLPVAVQQNQPWVFTDIILERVFDVNNYKGGKILRTLNEIQRIKNEKLN